MKIAVQPAHVGCVFCEGLLPNALSRLPVPGDSTFARWARGQGLHWVRVSWQ